MLAEKLKSEIRAGKNLFLSHSGREGKMTKPKLGLPTE